MVTPKPERALDIVDIQIGIASQGATSGLAFRLFLRDGQPVVFALPIDRAKEFSTALQNEIRRVEAAEVSERKH